LFASEIPNVAAESRAAATFVHMSSLSLTTLVNAREGSIDTDRYLQNLDCLAYINELDAKRGARRECDLAEFGVHQT
jgi:hypothetical protein